MTAAASFFTLLHQEMLLFYSDTDEADESHKDDNDTEDKVNQAMDDLFKERGFTIYEGTPDRIPLHQFSLKGCSIMSTSERTLSLANGQSKTCELSFKTHK